MGQRFSENVYHFGLNILISRIFVEDYTHRLADFFFLN